MMADKNQTAAIISAALLPVLWLEYCSARVMDQYLSRLIRQILRMDAVQSNTSMAFQRSHQTLPKYQYPIISFANENGMITSPRRKSATARDAMNQFCVDFRVLSVKILFCLLLYLLLSCCSVLYKCHLIKRLLTYLFILPHSLCNNNFDWTRFPIFLGNIYKTV